MVFAVFLLDGNRIMGDGALITRYIHAAESGRFADNFGVYVLRVVCRSCILSALHRRFCSCRQPARGFSGSEGLFARLGPDDDIPANDVDAVLRMVFLRAEIHLA